MVIGVPRELQPGEQRAALIPASIQKLVRAGAQVEADDRAEFAHLRAGERGLQHGQRQP